MRSVRECAGVGGRHARLSSRRRDEASHARPVPEWQRRSDGQSPRRRGGARRSHAAARRARLDAGRGGAGDVARSAGARGRPAAADRGVRPEQARGGAAARPLRGRAAGDIVRPAAVYGPRDRDFLRVFRLAARSIAMHAVPRENRVLDRPRRGPRRRAAARRASIRRPSDARTTSRTTRADAGRELYAEIASAASCVRDARPPGAAAGPRARGRRRRHPQRRHRLAHAGQPPQDQARAAPLVAVRSEREPGSSSAGAAIPLQHGVRETYLWYLAARWMRARTHGKASVPSKESQV